jgi:hypothetical protein
MGGNEGENNMHLRGTYNLRIHNLYEKTRFQNEKQFTSSKTRRDPASSQALRKDCKNSFVAL